MLGRGGVGHMNVWGGGWEQDRDGNSAALTS